MGLISLLFCCLLPYTTWIREGEISVLLQTYLKNPGSIPESFGVTLASL
jgi:hypothetical protein